MQTKADCSQRSQNNIENTAQQNKQEKIADLYDAHSKQYENIRCQIYPKKQRMFFLSEPAE